MKKILLSLSLLTISSFGYASDESADNLTFCERTEEFIEAAKVYRPIAKGVMKELPTGAISMAIQTIQYSPNYFGTDLQKRLENAENVGEEACAIVEEDTELQKRMNKLTRSTMRRGVTKEELREEFEVINTLYNY